MLCGTVCIKLGEACTLPGMVGRVDAGLEVSGDRAIILGGYFISKGVLPHLIQSRDNLLPTSSCMDSMDVRITALILHNITDHLA